MTSTYIKIQETLKPLTGEKVSLTARGRLGFGNCNLAVHFNQANLVSKILLRHDLMVGGKTGVPAVQYQSNFALETMQPWTVLEGDGVITLAGVPATLQCEDNLFLDQSREVNRAVLAVFDEVGFKRAFIRKWTAQGKGIGLEVIVIVDTDEEFGIYECSMNYYIMPDSERLAKDLIELHKTHGKIMS